MKTLLEVLQLSTEFLRAKESAAPRKTAEELLAHVLGLKSRLDLYLQFDRPLEEKELAEYRALLKRSALHEPYAYIMGHIEFYGCHLKIDRRALIPRVETELLIHAVIKKVRGKKGGAFDVCTGSGALGLALKKACPEFTVYVSDFSSDALALAQENAEMNALDVTCLQGDLLEPFKGLKTDLFICNPPYVSEGEWESLDSSIKNYEPSLALKAAGKHGEAFYERLSSDLPAYLNPGALIFLEIGKDQGRIVLDLFQKKGYREQKIEKDYSGHDRFFFAEFHG